MRFFLFVTSIFIVQGLSAQKIQPLRVDRASKDTPINHWIIEPSNDKQKADQELKLIIQLRAEPKAPSQGRQQNTSLLSEHTRFIKDLDQLTRSATSSRSKTATIIRHEYSNTFNGFAITTTKEIKDEIVKLPYVVKVSEDKVVEAFDVTSNDVIRAPQAWQQFGVTGKNVKIGIIDTGIDYNHPELGQGFGPGFKVVDGYDFVNEDNDPIDDHGHGTHVAGIAAANGATLKGVAPDATLVAYKVLDSGGSGFDSWILAAIERCVDPDQNPNTDDKLDVVNMSLGRYADPDEPMSEAVNNAIAQGVIFVVAAGNSYDYFTIGTPGVAKNAITVGATDNYKNTAAFSSKGPTERTFLMKPEVSAPGVDVYSTFLNGGYQSLSGTSMASPHVAGAVALLLEKNPDCTPELAKSVLMGTSRSMAPYLFDQGTGVIDIYEALNAKFACSPGVVDFGVSPSSSGMFQKTVTLTISNQGDASASFNLEAEGSIIAAPFSITITPASFTLNSNESRQVQVSLETNLANVARLNLPDAYSGVVNISSAGFTHKAPIFFLNPQKTKVNFSGELPLTVIVIGIEGTNYWKSFYPSTSSVELMLANGKYDLISFYNENRMVITEGVNTEANIELTLDKSLAKNLIAFKPVDPDGNDVALGSLIFGGGFFTGKDRNIITSMPFLVDSLYISDQQHYRWEFKGVGKVDGSNRYYEVLAGTDFGVYEDTICSNDPEAFSKIDFRNPSVAQNDLQQMNVYMKSGTPWTWFTSWNYVPIQVPSDISFYQTQHPLNSGFIGSFFSFSPMPEQPGYVWETADIRAEAGDDISFYQNYDRKIVTVEQKEFTYPFGGTIPNFILKPNHDALAIRYETLMGRGAFNHALGERSQGTTHYKLYNQDAIIKEGHFNQARYTQSESIFPAVENLAPGEYNLDFEYTDFQTAGKFGKATLYTTFNTSKPDLNPPALKSVHLRVNGKDTNQFEQGETAILNFSLHDWCEWGCHSDGLKTPLVKIKNESSVDWISLPLEMISEVDFTAAISPELAEGYYSLQIVSEDNSGNKITYEVLPAFHVGTPAQSLPYTTINLIEPKNFSQNAGTTPLFRWTGLEATSYTIEISNSSDFVDNVMRYNSTDNKYQLISELVQNSTYFWRVRPVYQTSVGNWSTIFTFNAKQLPRAELLTPANHSTIDENAIVFEWAATPGTSAYQLEISLDPDFSQLFRNEATGGTQITLYNFFPHTKYYWRVRSIFWIGWEQEHSFSSVFDFTTEGFNIPTLFSPVHGSVDQPFYVTCEWSVVPFASQYHLELSTTDNFSTYVEYYLNQTSSGILALAPNTDYFWRVSALMPEGSRSTSSINKFRTIALPAPLLLAPLDDAIDVVENSVLEWEDVANSNNYLVQLSNDMSFNSILTQATTNEKTYVLDDLKPYTNYFWRVISQVTVGNQTYQSTSSVFKFTTHNITSVSDFEERASAHVYPNPFQQTADFVIKSERDCSAALTIVDNMGKVIKRFSVRLNNGENTIAWDGKSLDGAPAAPGLYIAILAKEQGPTVVIRLAKTR